VISASLRLYYLVIVKGHECAVTRAHLDLSILPDAWRRDSGVSLGFGVPPRAIIQRHIGSEP
jgi:hypothetical protein